MKYDYANKIQRTSLPIMAWGERFILKAPKLLMVRIHKASIMDIGRVCCDITPTEAILLERQDW